MMSKPPVSHAAWLKSKKSTLNSTSNSMESISTELLQKISDLEKTMSTETEKIMKYLRKVEDQSQKRDHEAFRRINDLENGGLSRRGKRNDVYIPKEKSYLGAANGASRFKYGDTWLESGKFLEKAGSKAKAKKSKRKKKQTKRKKKQTKRKKR